MSERLRKTAVAHIWQSNLTMSTEIPILFFCAVIPYGLTVQPVGPNVVVEWLAHLFVLVGTSRVQISSPRPATLTGSSWFSSVPQVNSGIVEYLKLSHDRLFFTF
jgi:hypothetical protein